MDTRLLVEVEDGEVTVRATRDTFSARRKAYFIRELAAEGFIPDEYRRYAPDAPEAFVRAVRWIIDSSWLAIDPGLFAPPRRYAFLGLLTLMVALLVGFASADKLGSSRPGSPSSRTNRFAPPGTLVGHP